MAIRVLIISDHRLLMALLMQFLQSEPARFMLLGTVEHLDETEAEVKRAQPDIVLYDTDAGTGHLMQMLSFLHAASPHSKVLLFGRSENKLQLEEALLLGARGILDRNTTPEQLMHAVEKVHEGQVWLDRATTARVFVELARKKQSEADTVSAKTTSILTDRERAVVQAISTHMDAPRKVIANQLNISDSTLRNHLSVIYEKVGVSTRGGLLAYAIRNGYLDVSD